MRIKATLLITIILIPWAMSLIFQLHIITLITSVTIVLIGGYIIDVSDQIARKQSLVAPIEQENCPEMLALCQEHEKIRLYQNKVASIGRPLTQGEFQAAKAWMDKEHAKATRVRQQEACATLASQV